MNNEEYIEIDLKEMLFHVFYQWKRIFTVALVLALVLGGAKFALGSVPDQPDTDVWTDMESYQQELALRRERVKAVQDKVNTLQVYIDNAVMMKADYRNVYVAKASYYIDTEYQILPENTYQTPDKTGTLTWYYCNYLQDREIYEKISQSVGVEAKYLMDLVQVSVVNDNTLSLSVTHPYQRPALQIMEHLQEALAQIGGHLENTIGDHQMTRMLNSCGVYVDEDLKNRQQSINNEMLQYQQELIKCQEELEAFKEAGAPDGSSLLKDAVKWAVLGGLAGCMLAVVWYAGKDIFGGRVLTGESAARCGKVKLLGSLYRERKLDPVTRWLRRLEGRPTKVCTADEALLAANLRLHCSQDRIMLYGDTGMESSAFAARRLQSLMQMKLIPQGSLVADAAALDSLEENAAAVLVVAVGSTRKKDVAKSVKILCEKGKEILGVLVLD